MSLSWRPPDFFVALFGQFYVCLGGSLCLFLKGVQESTKVVFRYVVEFIFLMLIYNILYTGGQEKAGSIQAVPASFSDHRPGGKLAKDKP
jgi:hypothetical protein